MNQKLTAFLAAWLCFALNFAQAQISGTVSDNTKQTVPGATVLLYKDSSLFKSQLTDNAGHFAFDKLTGPYKIKVSFVGYQTYQSNITAPSELSIVLLPQATALQEVSVKGSRPLIERQIDRTVVNVDALLTASGGTLLDALDKSPGVQVDANGGISLQGKSGVTVYIDDRPTHLSGEDLAAYLRAQPASTVDRIELMSNPPAKYEAAGNSGVINIRTKKIKSKGFNGSLNAAYNQGELARSNNSLNLNFKQNKFNIVALISYNLGNNLTDIDLNRHFDPAIISNIAPNFSQQAAMRRHSDNYNSRLTVDYAASKNTTLGIVLSGLLTKSSLKTANVSLLSSQQPDSSITANNQDHRTFKNSGLNLNFAHDFNTKTNLTADLDGLTYHSDLNQELLNRSFSPNGSQYTRQQEAGILPTAIHIYSAKTDFSRKFNAVNFGAGLKSSYTSTDNLADYHYIVNQGKVADFGKSNHFLYHENINAAYMNLNKDWKYLSLQAGLRFENTGARGRQLGNVQQADSAFTRNYNGLFPTFYAVYKLDTTHTQQFSFNYGRRIDRPYYADLNPFLAPLDKFTYNQGNPFLKPSFSDNLSLTYSYKEFAATFTYSLINDKTDGLVQIINGYYYNKPGNIGRNDVQTLEMEGGGDLTNTLNIHLYGYLMFQHTQTDFYTGRLDTRGTGVFIRPVITFRPGKDWTLQADGYYQSKITSGQFIDADRKTVNLAIAKKLSSSTTIKLAANDLFKSLNNAWQIGYLRGTTADYRSTSDTRNIVLSLNYRFGSTIKAQRQHQNTSNDDEKNRIKN